MSETEHERLADELEQQAGEMEQRSESLQEDVEQARGDWQAKRADPGVPGAVPQDEDDRSPEPEDPASFPGKTDER
jgi:hypothetical protein